MMSSTKDVTREDDAAPMMKAIASPIIPKVFRKSKNSCDSDFFAGGCGGASVISPDRVVILGSL